MDNAAQSWLDGRGVPSLHASWPEVRLFELAEVWCTGDQGSLFFSESQLFDVCPTIQRLPDRAVRRPIPALARRIESPVFHLTGFSHENHGHFILHHLPRLIACRDLLEEILDMKILVAPGHKKWQCRYLDALGIDASRVIEGSHGTLSLRRVFYVPWIAGSFKLVSLHLLRVMRERFAQVVDLEAVGSRAVLFVSRQDAPDKLLANEMEIFEATRRFFGDEVILVQLSKLSMKEQITLFSTAKLVVGPLGQGLTNIIYCNAPRLITLDPFDGPGLNSAAQMFSSLATACGGEGVSFHSCTTYRGNKREWTFPVDRYLDYLGRIAQRWWPAPFNSDLR